MTQREPSSLPLIASLLAATIFHALFLSIQWSTPNTRSTPALIVATIVSAAGQLDSQKISTLNSDVETDSMQQNTGVLQTHAGSPSPLATANAISASPAEELEALDVKKNAEKTDEIILSKKSDIKQEKRIEEQQEAALPINNTTAKPETGAKQSLAGQTQTLSNPDELLTSDDYFIVAKTWLHKHIVDLRSTDDYRSGTTTVKVTLKYGGVVTAVKIQDSSGVELLDKSAKQSVLAANPFPAPPKDKFNHHEFSISIFYDKEH